jgi:hypothetical protein
MPMLGTSLLPIAAIAAALTLAAQSGGLPGHSASF